MYNFCLLYIGQLPISNYFQLGYKNFVAYTPADKITIYIVFVIVTLNSYAGKCVANFKIIYRY